MSTFLYQIDGERSVIHTDLLPGFVERGKIDARDWLHAKAGLGFDLTPLQRQMLPLGEAGRMNLHRMDTQYGR